MLTRVGLCLHQDFQDAGMVRMPPYGPPAQRGDGLNMLRPYGFADTYPSQEGP